jgi:tRNA A37 threonylcarbamoyladenosine biosynthesis protein TsaE
LEIEEILAGPGVKAVEWAERLPFAVPSALRLSLAAGGAEGQREIVELASEGASEGRS